MLKFLREHEVATHFRAAMKKSPEAVVAVPFWGKGAVATLGLSEGNAVRILCNLDHPGCNPEVIAEIRDLGIKVWTHPRLHAKIYATKHTAIVGSSNVSTNGLTVEGVGSRGWIEANVCCDDQGFVNKVLEFFETIWEEWDTREVTEADIQAARALRRKWPIPTDRPETRTLLAACRERPNDFNNVYVAAYGEDLGKKGKALLRSVQAGAQRPVHGLDVSDFRNAWGYQFDAVPEGAWLIDLDCRRLSRPKIHGCAKVTGLRLKVDGEVDLTIAVRGVITAPGSGARLLLSAAEKNSLISNAKRLTRHRLLPLTEAIKIIDRRK